jgi:hypothetical protein
MGNNLPLISVVLANYNGAEHLAEAIESVVAQDYDNFEFIVVDDGSTDGSRDIIRAFAKRFPEKIVPICKAKNEGQAEGFNVGVARAKGELVSFIDSDDLWFPHKLSMVQRTFGDPERVVFHQHNLKLLREGIITEEPFRDVLTSGNCGPSANRMHFLPKFIPTSGLTFSQRVLDKILPVPKVFRVCADGYMTRTSLPFGEVSAVNEYCGAYRVHESNTTFMTATFNAAGYLYNILMPSIFEFYEKHGVQWRFGHATEAEFVKALSSIKVKEGDRILMIRCAPPEVIERIVAVLSKIAPSLTIDLLAQSSIIDRVAHLPVNIIPIGEGMIGLDAIGDDAFELLGSQSYDLGVVPYNSRYGNAYGNVHKLLRKLTDCSFVGIGTDGSVQPLIWQSWPIEEGNCNG